MVSYEHTFATAESTIDQALEREREACRRELVANFAEQARLQHRATQLVREADDRGDWSAAGFTTSTQWLAQLSNSDYRTAQRITSTSDALRHLPALDHAMSKGSLMLDQVAAATPFATPQSDAEIARLAVGKAPSQISLAARTIVPPKVADDHELYQRRSLSMTWTNGGRELVLGGACHSNRAPRSSKPSAASPSNSARATNRPAPSSTGNNPPPTRSSPSPGKAATAPMV